MPATFFGSSRRQLFGFLHPARAGARRDFGVILCYPLPHEYMLSHWAYRRLAIQLASEGVPAMRFDYAGTGDSAGELGEATVEGWIADIATAAAEIQESTGVSRVSLLGFRFGAALAWLAASRLQVRDLLLWEPVADGRLHLQELAARDEWRKLQDRVPRIATKGVDEMLGFTMAPALRAAIEGVHLASGPAPAADRIIVAVSEENDDSRELARLAGPPGQLLVVPEPKGTAAAEDDVAMLALPIQAEMVRLLANP